MKYLFYILLPLLLLTACKKEPKEDFRDKVLGHYVGIMKLYNPIENNTYNFNIDGIVKIYPSDPCNIVSFDFTDFVHPDTIKYKFSLSEDYTFDTGAFLLNYDSLVFNVPNNQGNSIKYYMKKDF